MSTETPETMISYKELEDIEKQFEDVEIELVRQQALLSKSLYTKRQTLVSKIPNFWPLVLEAAPQEIDEYIQPSDQAVLLSSLKSLSVERFDVESAGGDPRSFLIRWEFNENEYFEDSVLEKKFWHRRGLDGSEGLVSEPVDIKWKKGKDLTDGLLGLVKKMWDEERKNPSKAKPKSEEDLSAEQKALKEKIENTGMGGISFFAWFGFIGRRVSAEEDKTAKEKEREKRKAREEAVKKGGDDEEEEDEDDEQEEDEEELLSTLEIFPDGDDLAVAIAEDLWPNAIQYFIAAQEQENMSEMDFEEDSDNDEAPSLVEIDDHKFEMRPAKKQKTQDA